MHRVFTAMKHVKYGADGDIHVRGGVWRSWLRDIEFEIQPELDAAKHLVEDGFVVSPEQAQAAVVKRATRLRAEAAK